MAFRRPRLRLQPNVVARPTPPKQEPEQTAPAPAPAPTPTPVASPIAAKPVPVPTATPSNPSTAPTPSILAAAPAPAAAAAAPVAAEQPSKPRPHLPSRFKRLAPRLDVGRSVAAAAAATESARKDGSTGVPPDGATGVATGALATAGGATPETCAPPASSPVSVPPAPPAAPAADAVACPAPAKRPRLDSARLPEPPELTEPEPEPEREPDDPDDPMDPDDPASTALSESAPKQRQKQVKKEKQQKQQKERKEPEEEQPPPSPPLSTSGDGEGGSPPPALLSEEDLFLRKRFNTPRTKSNTRELLEQISERVVDNMPIRSKMRMQDLILWNPSTEAMSNSKEKPPNRRRKRRDSTSSVMSCRTEAGEETADEPTSAAPATPAPATPAPLVIPDLEPEPEQEEQDAMPVPQLKVGPDGNIVIDEKSLVVQTTQQKQRDQELSTELVNDMTGSRLSFNGYRQRRKIDEWSIKETARFYKALSTVGTDFSIMQQLFPQRTRVDLKKKFKKEERKNPHLVERAMTDNMQYDLTIFDGDVWEKTVENCKTAAQVKREEERERRRQERERDAKQLRMEKAARRPRRRAFKNDKQADTAASILDGLKTPLEKPGPVRRRKPRGRENVCPPAEDGAGSDGSALLPPVTPDLALDWTSQEPGPASLAPIAVAPAGSVLPQGATPWQPPGGQGGVLQLPPGVNPQNLLIVASPCPDRPDGQVLHVYMIQPPAGQAPDVNVTVPHNQGPAAPVVAAPGAVPIASVTTGPAAAGAAPVAAGTAGPLPMNEVLGLPWVGDTAQQAVQVEPGVDEQETAQAGTQQVAGQEAADVKGAEVADLAMLKPMVVSVEEAQPTAAAAEAGVTDPAEHQTPAQGLLKTPAGGVETRENVGSEDTADGPDTPGTETEETTGVVGEGEIVLGMVSDLGGTISEGEEGKSLPGSQHQSEEASSAQQQVADVPAVGSREGCEPVALTQENWPVTTEPDVQDSSSSDFTIPPGPRAEASGTSGNEPGAMDELETRETKPTTPGQPAES